MTMAAQMKNNGNMRSSSNSGGGRKVSLHTFAMCIGCCITSFYIGLMLGMNHSHGIQHDCHCAVGKASAAGATSSFTDALTNPLGACAITPSGRCNDLFLQGVSRVYLIASSPLLFQVNLQPAAAAANNSHPQWHHSLLGLLE